MTFDPYAARKRSRQLARRLGVEVAPSLPLLDEDVVRGESDVETRALALHAAVASAFGFDRARARQWLERNGLWLSSSPRERALLEEGPKDEAAALRLQVETLYAFAWMLSLVDELDFSAPCPDTVVTLYPDLRCDEDASFQERAQLRSAGEILAAADLAYCLHWAMRQAQLEGERTPGRVDAYVAEERRRALDWVLSEEEWDALTLDT